MRLYLSILRNSLPPVKTVWPLSDAQQRWTIAQLLENVNDTFPLEAEHWGLEDYIVTSAGFECIHHHEISRICKDDDALTIRPLQTAEIRARTLSGRTQISEGGRHLIDGVAFGKTALRSPVRPNVRIPPRKRRKLSKDEDTQSPLLLENGKTAAGDEDTSDDSDDEDFDDAEDQNTSSESEVGLAESSDEDSSSSKDTDSSSDQSSEDEESSESDTDEDSSDTQSDNSSEVSVDKVKSAKAPITTSKKRKLDVVEEEASPSAKRAESKQKLQKLKPQDDTSAGVSKKKAVSFATEQEIEDVKHEPESTKRQGIPFEGAGATKSRNARRRAKKQLDYLKSTGALPPEATYADLEAYNNHGVSQEGRQDSLAARQEQLLRAIAAGGIDVDDDAVTNGEHESSAVEDTTMTNGVHDSSEADDGPEQASSKQQKQTVSAAQGPTEHVKAISTGDALSLIPPAVARRSRLDLAASKRLLFGSLGVRVPKTDAERDRTRSRLASGHGQEPPTIGKHNEHNSDDEAIAHDYEDWSSKIELSAVECCDEGITLSTPPFPFVQRWDPQYAQIKKRGRQGKKHRQQTNGYLTESYDKYNAYTGDALNYDEEEQYPGDEHWEEGALLDGEYDEHPDSAMIIDDGFPPVPDNLQELPQVSEQEVKQGDFVAFVELVCSAATNWQPTFLTRTVKLLDRKDDRWRVKIAQRDQPSHEYDEEGQRVYSKFDMHAMSDDEAEADESERSLAWHELMQPRLIA